MLISAVQHARNAAVEEGPRFTTSSLLHLPERAASTLRHHTSILPALSDWSAPDWAAHGALRCSHLSNSARLMSLGSCFTNPVDSITNSCGTARRAFIATNLSGRAIFACNSFIFGRGRLCLPTAAW